jgi:putative transposase
MEKMNYSGYRFPPIPQAIWLYLRFHPELAATWRICWLSAGSSCPVRPCNRHRPKIAADLRKRRPRAHTTWHLGEVYLKIDGRLVYLWRAVDAEGEVLDVLVQTKRDRGPPHDAQALEEIWLPAGDAAD